MSSIAPYSPPSLARLLGPALSKVQYYERRFKVFAVVAILTFPLYYYLWTHVYPQPYESLALRLLGMALFVPLLFSNRLPTGFKRFLPFYWYFALFYSLPFFFAFMLLKNGGSDIWMGSALVAVFIMVLLLDWISLIVHFALGAGLAVLAFSLTGDAPLPPFHIQEFLAIIVFAILTGAVSNYDREKIRIEQERAMLATAGSIAHELRTPLLSIRSGAAGLAQYLPTLIEAYEQARAAKLPVAPLRSAHLDAMKGVLARIDTEAYLSNAIIDMLLMNVRTSGAGDARDLVPLSIGQCIEIALARYPFSEDERKLVSWNANNDFVFRGIELLMVHVIFNLLKNALRHIARAGKGTIEIRVEPGAPLNRLVFRDSGAGIDPAILPHVFARFYTSADNSDSLLGAGIGLAFCREAMTACGGSIDCASVPGQFTEFELKFPPP